jgi:hypothetical protein
MNVEKVRTTEIIRSEFPEMDFIEPGRQESDGGVHDLVGVMEHPEAGEYR